MASAHEAHIRVRMVTGDDVVTGAAIAKQLDIPGEAILGADFAALSEPERLERIDDIGVVGRVAPEHKVLLAETLKKKGDVVAMTGDGVNDAPAIKAADIGVAMGSGTEVAKNAGRMILSDDNFATIVYAVEQGRKLYDNLNKYIRFVLLELVAFVLTFLGATLLNLAAGQPFTPSQILWVNFLVNAPFGVALGFDQESPGPDGPPPSAARGVHTDNRGDDHLRPGGPVRRRGQPRADRDWEGPLRQHRDGPVDSARGLHADARGRAPSKPAARPRRYSAASTFNSSRMNMIALAELAGAFLITQADFLRRLLGTAPLTAQQGGLALSMAVLLLIGWEIGKWVARRRARTEAVTVPAG